MDTTTTIARQKDLDDRPMLIRVRDALAVGTTVLIEDTRADDGDLTSITVSGQTVTVTARKADAIKGVVFSIQGLTDRQKKSFNAGPGIRYTSLGRGIEVSWRGLEAACAVLVKAMTEKPVAPRTPRAPKAAPAPLSDRLMGAIKASPAVHWHMERTEIHVRSRTLPSASVSITSHGDGFVIIGFPYAPEAVAAIKAVGRGRYAPTLRKWIFVAADEVRLLAAIEQASRICGVAEEARKAAYEAAAPARAQYAVEQQAERAAVSRADSIKRAAASRAWHEANPSVLMLMSAPYSIGQVIETGTDVLIVTKFGKRFRVDGDMPSYVGSYLLGHEGDLCCYAYCRRATEAEVEARYLAA